MFHRGLKLRLRLLGYPHQVAPGKRAAGGNIIMQGAIASLDMAQSLFQKPLIRPVDLLEDFVEKRGDLRARQTNVAGRSPSQKHPLIVTIAWIICAAFCIGVWFIARFIIDTLTMYRF